MRRSRVVLGIIAFWIAVMSLGACSCGSEQIRDQTPTMRSDLVTDDADADFLVEFGGVLVGDVATRRFRIENVGSAGLSVQVQRPAAPFGSEPSPSLSSIDVGESAELSFTYEPEDEREEGDEAIIELVTNEVSGGKTYRLRLRGRGVEAPLDCVPDVLDFGAVLIESTATLRTTCTNPHPVSVDAKLGALRGNHAIYFSAAFVGGNAEERHIEAGASAEIEVKLRAQSLGINEAELEIRDQLLQPIARLPLQAQVVLSKILVEPATCLDFSYVNIGATATRSLDLVNVGSDDVDVTAIDVPAADQDDFSVVTPLPLHLEGNGGRATVEIAFHPQEGGSRQVQLQIRTSEDNEPTSACVTGFGGGPVLSCTPTIRDLGMVGIGYPATGRFDCSNAGVAPAGTPIDPLVIQAIEVEGGPFSTLVRNPDGTTGAKAAGYKVGERFQVEVIYDPQDVGFDQTTVLVRTNVNEVELNVAGEGRDIEPCDFSVDPPSVRFGVVARNRERVLDFSIQNHGPTSCLVRDLRLSDDSSPTFEVEPFDWKEIEAGGRLSVPIHFKPTANTPIEKGSVLFEISHPTEKDQQVALSGASANVCLLVEPQEIDFGATAPGCQALSREVLISNVCGIPITLTSIEVNGSADAEDFSVIRRPPLPLTLNAQDYVVAEVAFDPIDLGEQRATLEVEASGNQPVHENLYVADLVGEGSENTRQVDDFTASGRPAIDILWVIDNSGSMGSYQAKLQKNLPAFMTFATEQRADFHIGVTTTALRYGGAGCPGGADGAEDGRLFPIDGSHPRILTPNTPNLQEHWEHNVAVGTCFGPNEESALEGAYRALSPPLIHEHKDSRYNSPYQDGNAGFLRADASLSIILVSDARDYSPRPNAEYIDFFLRLKQGRRHMVKVHGITGNRANVGQSCAQPGDKMIDVIEALEGTWLSLCTADSDAAWAEALENMSKGVFTFGKRHVLRGFPGDANGDGTIDAWDIEVQVNGRNEPPIRGGSRVWTYDPISNAIDFEPLYVPKAGAEIRASYDLACR